MLKFSIDWIKDKYEDCKFSLSLFKSRLTKASGKWTISKIRLHSAACPPWIEQLGWAMQTVPPSLNNKNVKWRIYCTWICKFVVYCFFFNLTRKESDYARLYRVWSFLSVSLLLLMRDYFDTAIILFGHCGPFSMINIFYTDFDMIMRGSLGRDSSGGGAGAWFMENIPPINLVMELQLVIKLSARCQTVCFTRDGAVAN